MDSKISILIERASNEILVAESLKKISDNNVLKKEFELASGTSFYSSVISHSYYAIFYSAKAYLISKKVALTKQGQHQKVFFEFSKMVKKGILDEELLKMYKEVKVKAEVLLDILKNEREKRTNFTYETLPQANKQPAEESLENALRFLSHIKGLLR